MLVSGAMVGMEGLEPSRREAHDPKSCLSTNSSTSPEGQAPATVNLSISDAF